MLQPIQHKINLGVLIAMAIVPVPLLVAYLLAGDAGGTAGAATGLLVNSLLLLAYARGMQRARYGIILVAPLIIAFALSERTLLQVFHPVIFMAPAIALVLSGRTWVIGVALASYLLILARAGFSGIYFEPEMIISYLLVVAMMILSRITTEYAIHASNASAAEASAQALRASEALALTTQQAEALARRNDDQQRLLELVSALETPVVSIADGVLVAPIIGHLDTRRAQQLTGRLLEAIGARRARLLIVDLSGVAVVDTSVAAALERLVRSVKLLGCRVTLTGIAPAVAGALAQLGIGFDGVIVAATPQQALDQLAPAVAA